MIRDGTRTEMLAIAEQERSKENMSEQPVDVDSSTGLFGILTIPPRDVRDTGFIFINSGLLHRVGPFRLYVEIARRLAGCGFASIRLDQPGKGDSDPMSGLPLQDATVKSVTAAAEYLKRETGAKKFVVGGLCSGADDALQAATDIPALEGLFLFDGYAPKTLRYYLNRYGPKLVSKEAWLKRLRPASRRDPAAVSDISLRNWSSRGEMVGQYRSIIAKGIKLLAVFTSGAGRFYNYPTQLTSALGPQCSDDLVTECLYSEATHLFPVSAHRKAAVDGFIDWADRVFA